MRIVNEEGGQAAAIFVRVRAQVQLLRVLPAPLRHLQGQNVLGSRLSEGRLQHPYRYQRPLLSAAPHRHPEELPKDTSVLPNGQRSQQKAVSQVKLRRNHYHRC